MRDLLSFILITLLTLSACTNKKSEESHTLTTKTERIKLVDNSAKFLGLFKTINPIGLHIYPPKWDSLGKINTTRFVGIKIDTKKFDCLQNKEVLFNIDAYNKGEIFIHAIYKFQINDKYLGLIIRHYSQYDESLVELLLWNKKERIIETGIELADSFGDAGWYFNLESWVTKFEYNKELEIVSRRKDFIPKDEDYPGDEYKYDITTDSLKISRLTNSRFITKLENQKDTIKYKLRNWK